MCQAEISSTAAMRYIYINKREFLAWPAFPQALAADMAKLLHLAHTANNLVRKLICPSSLYGLDSTSLRRWMHIKADSFQPAERFDSHAARSRQSESKSPIKRRFSRVDRIQAATEATDFASIPCRPRHASYRE
jgi:hypothetical protein